MSGLLELAARCEAAEGPSRHLDTQIAILLEPDAQHIIGEEPGRFPRKPIYGPRSTFWEWALDESKEPPIFGVIPTYTASLDAALTLKPKGWAWQTGEGIETEAGPVDRAYAWTAPVDEGELVFAATPALALCAAALKACGQ